MNVKSKLKVALNRILGLFPSKIPQGLTEFNDFVTSIVETYSPPGDERSIRFVISSIIMRLGPTEAYKPKKYFANSLYRAAGSQVAVYVQEMIKQEQRAEQEEAQKAAVKAQQEKQQAEAIAPSTSSVEQQVSN